jgi:predicted phage-related endonuclease
LEKSDVLPVQMGIYTEDFNISWFEKQTGIKVVGKQIFITSKKYPFMYCNIDGVLQEKKALLECKHTNAFSNEVKTAEKYKAQLQHYLMVYGADKIYLSIFFGNMKYGLVEVLPDKEFQEQLLAAEVLFWHLVETKTPPPDFVEFKNFDIKLKEFNDGKQIIPLLTRESTS